MKKRSNGVVERWNVGKPTLRALVHSCHTPTKSILCFTLWALLFGLSDPAAAQQLAKIAKIGWLANRRPASSPSSATEVIRRELGALCWVEAKNIPIEIPLKRRTAYAGLLMV